MHQNEWFQVWFFKNFLGRGSPSPSPDPSPRFFSGFALGSGFALNSRALRFSRPRLGLRPRYSGASRPRIGLRPYISIGDLGLAPPPKINSWIRLWLEEGVMWCKLLSTSWWKSNLKSVSIKQQNSPIKQNSPEPPCELEVGLFGGGIGWTVVAIDFTLVVVCWIRDGVETCWICLDDEAGEGEVAFGELEDDDWLFEVSFVEVEKTAGSW